MPRYSKYIAKLRKICNSKNFEIQEIGKTRGKRKFLMYKMVINPKGKRTVCFSAGIHGDEITAPNSILLFLKHFDKKKFKNIRIIVIPVANPYGYENGKREGYLGRKLNRLFTKRKLSAENKILYDAVKNEKIFFFHALHEDYEEYKFYMYLFGNPKEKIYMKIPEIAEKYFEINLFPNIEKESLQRIDERGRVINMHDGSFEDRMSRTARYSICTEAPGMQPMREKIKLDLALMSKILNFVNNYK